MANQKVFWHFKLYSYRFKKIEKWDHVTLKFVKIFNSMWPHFSIFGLIFYKDSDCVIEIWFKLFRIRRNKGWTQPFGLHKNGYDIRKYIQISNEALTTNQRIVFALCMVTLGKWWWVHIRPSWLLHIDTPNSDSTFNTTLICANHWPSGSFVWGTPLYYQTCRLLKMLTYF